MRARKVIKLYQDAELQQHIRAQCRRHSHREDLQGIFYSAAWEWIATEAPDRCHPADFRRMVYNAIRRAYRVELKKRHFLAELFEAHTRDEVGPQSCVTAARSSEKAIVLEERSWIQEVEPGVLMPLPAGPVLAQETIGDDWN